MNLLTYTPRQVLTAAQRLRLLRGGQRLLSPACTQSRVLASYARDWLERQLPATGATHARLQSLGQALAADPGLQSRYRALLETLGCDPHTVAVDRPRLRAILPGAEQLAAAQPAFYAHRDTWYANPAAQINLWLPLGDYAATQTFWFWPEAFGCFVANDSARFDYADWQRQTGFQNPNPSPESVYPRAQDCPGQAEGFACQSGDLLLFAAAQLHQTRPNPGPQIRLSLDLRLVWPEDLGPERQAPDPDNQSRGSTLTDYRWLRA